MCMVLIIRWETEAERFGNLFISNKRETESDLHLTNTLAGNVANEPKGIKMKQEAIRAGPGHS